ncbi:L-lactate dehydrogenase complex protein LldE [Hymenobacter daecheongensis DSM 21074]|uniref:L-lactate dehydrogenase complex protein LldE n=1 Tax=Hymenobacter daecheongensis DSM 21074 TaxID=1121955 RepID=A0A1M6JQE4_9BACT|nr:(Fe-S)-binding protein [Hymenobacter daecheongensis]SHJ48894.1 L-lactate dehydrogenase complex protein LldE [Hymenobacter daecheongensis DSM 21074]
MPTPQVDLFIPCFVDQLFPDTAMNMVKVLEKLGCAVHYNANQTCCGQPAYNAGYKTESCEVATKFLNDFPSAEGHYIVSPSASCVGMVRNAYAGLFEGSADQGRYHGVQRRIFELTEFIVDVLGVPSIAGARLAGKYTYHDSCSALRECGIRAAPRQLLDAVQGLERLEMAETETCCGFGGTFAVKFEAISVAMAEQKVEHALATGADYLISTDTSCLMHLDAYIRREKKPIKTLHVADVLASGW